MRGGRRRRARRPSHLRNRKGRSLRGVHGHGAFASTTLVLATGGLSIPKMGATGFTHDTVRRLGLALVDPRPGLVPFTLAVPPLSGVSLEVVATLDRAHF